MADNDYLRDFKGANSDIPLPADEHDPNSLASWKKRITASEQRIKPLIEKWKKNILAYRGKMLIEAPVEHTAIVPKDYAFVEQKKAQLFFATPEVQLRALQPELEDAMPMFQARLNFELGPSGVDVMTMIEEVLFDVLCPAGLGVSKIGYEASVVMKEVPALPPDMAMGQMMGQPETGIGMAPPQAPQLEQVPQTVYECYYWKRISPGFLRVPSDFCGSDFDQAAWIGFEFTMDLADARRSFGLGEDVSGSKGSGNEFKIATDEADTEKNYKDRIRGWEIWYKASVFDPKEIHQKKIRRLVMLDGVDKAVAHSDSPYQRQGPDGQLLGMIGFPIEVLTTRYVADSCFPPSDCEQSRILVDELSLGRTQMLQQRERSMPLRLADLSRLGKDGLDKIKRAPIQGIIPLDSFSGAEPPIIEIARAEFPRENYSFNDYLDKDISEAWAMGPNQLGQLSPFNRSATEAQVAQQNASARLTREQNRVKAWFCRGAQKLGALIQLFDDQTDYVQILGPTGASRLAPWDRTAIQGKYAYSIKPDSGVPQDAVQAKQEAINQYQMLANEPTVNRMELVAATLRKINLDPARLILQQPPEKGPDPPNISYRFSGDDLDPTLPRFPIVLEILKQGGVQIPPEVLAAAQGQAVQQSLAMTNADTIARAGEGAAELGQRAMQEHGGPAEKQEGISAHQSRRTGRLEGPKAGE